MARCTATNRSGAQCGKHAIRGRTTCRNHGGRSLRGADHPSYRGRGYSKDLPARLGERFEAGLNDPGLTHLRAELALLDARIGELLPQTEDDGSWAEFEQLVNELAEAAESGELERLRPALGRVEAALQRGAKARRVWREVYRIVDLRRKTATAEHRRETWLGQNVTGDQFKLLLGTIHGLMMREAPEVRHRVLEGLRGMLGGTTGSRRPTLPAVDVEIGTLP